MDFFQRVKTYVKIKNTTIEDFMSSVFNGDKDRDSFNGWNRRKVFPRADESIKIAKAMGITVEELIDGETGAEYIRKIVRNDPKAIQVPDRIRSIVQDLLLLEEKELVGIRANIEALAEAKKGKDTGTDG